MKRYKLINNIFGWIAFAIAAVTYLLTIEPTASFWDCGEFISSAYRLEVGHPPGAPFFMLTARFFTLFASDPAHVAMMVNAMSALCSAFTILFLFWTITHIARKLIAPDTKNITMGKMVAILGSGMIGALAYTFSDTFWFSAVEGEVYAYSSLFTAVVFWLILKWEDSEGGVSDDRWFILIAYLMGLSIGVHLLNLLVVPAMVLVYYFKKFKPTIWGTLLALVVSAVILAFILYGLIPGFIKVASWIELLCVNTFHMHYNSGLLLYIVLTICSMVWAIYETSVGKSELRSKIAFLLAIFFSGVPFLGDSPLIGIVLLVILTLFLFLFNKKDIRRVMNTIVLCIAVMLVGYSSYSLLVIRSLANTPMDQNAPEDVFSLQYYLNREQYGDRPLIYGPVYSAPEELVVDGKYCVPIEKEGAKQYVQVEKKNANDPDRYVYIGRKHKGYKTMRQFNMFFPRMYKGVAVQSEHINAYKSWGKVKGKDIKITRCNKEEVVNCPTFGENLRFFFAYQLNFMYWRYFMWNFSGRQNDIASQGEIDHGNWITGIGFVDKLLVGDQKNLPSDLKNNKGHNTYFMIPFLLGVIGICFQLSRKNGGKESFWITFFLFFMTGIAIVMYLNQTPYQPRERDYAYAGSFYAYAIWIGLGVLGIYELLKKLTKEEIGAAALAIALCAFVPARMGAQNWDDHDRSGRTVCRDFGNNYLQSCAPNAIYFCNGDNDTFPVWYNQEVEGNRTDVRACNLSYIQASWYIDQMKRGAYESAPLPISWTHDQYRTGMLDMARSYDEPRLAGSSLDLGMALDIVRNPRFIDEDGIGFIPKKELTYPIDKEQVIATGTVAKERAAEIVDTMRIPLRGGIGKSDLMVLEMLNTNNWERPIYIAVTVGEQYYPDLAKYLQLEGLTYRLVPVASEKDKNVNTDAMFDNMMNKFRWGGVNNPKVYIDETVMRMCRTQRLMFSYLAKALIDENDTVRALAALDRCMEVLPLSTISVDYSCMSLAECYYGIGEVAKADSIARALVDLCAEKINWCLSLSPEMQEAVSRENSVYQNLGIMQNVCMTVNDYSKELEEEIYPIFEDCYNRYQSTQPKRRH